MDTPDAEDNMSSGSGTGSSCTTTNNSITSPESATGGIRSCSGCRTTKTPLWRGGPDGPKSLCNACGIRDRKRRRELLGINHKLKKHSPPTTPPAPAPAPPRASVAATITKKRNHRRRLLLWLKKTQQHPTTTTLIPEEEHAAFLLMALSCGLLCGA